MTSTAQSGNDLNRYLFIATLLTLPYINFPYVSSGTLKPLALIPLSLFLLLNPRLFFRKSFLLFLVFFILFVLYSTFLTALIPEELLANKPLRHPYLGTVQLAILGLFSYLAFYMGRFVLPSRFDTERFFRILLLAYYPALLFGFIHTIAIAAGTSNPLFVLRSLLASTNYPPTYYRNMMLTVEPSFAAADLAVILFPPAFYLFMKRKNLFSVLTLGLVILNLFATKSGLGFAMLLASALFLGLSYVKSLKHLVVSITVLLITLIAIANSTYIKERFSRIVNQIQASDLLEESTATRVVSYRVATRILSEVPCGTGYGNEGFFYPEYVPEKYLVLPLFKDWADPDSGRFPDIKSTLLKLVADFGIPGVLLVFFVLFFLFGTWKRVSSIPDRELAVSVRLFLLNMSIMSFSINLVGYIPIFLLLGYYLYLIQQNRAVCAILHSRKTLEKS